MTQYFGNFLDKSFTHELYARNIDCNLNRIPRNFLPSRGFHASALHNVSAQGDDQSIFFAIGMNLKEESHRAWDGSNVPVPQNGLIGPKIYQIQADNVR